MLEIPKNAVLIVCNTTDNPSVRNSSIEQCYFCGDDVWFAESTKTQIETDDEYCLICTKCMQKLPERPVFSMPTDEMIKEIAEENNLPFESVRKKIHEMVSANNLTANFENN